MFHENVIYEKKYKALRPPEMERLKIDFTDCDLQAGDTIRLQLSESIEKE